jgi:enolase-phosphatase E1
MKYILTDIEGTTTSINFVHDKLFPYAYEQMESFLKENKDSHVDLIQNVIDTVKEEDNKIIDLDGAIQTLKRWIKEDRKHPALKALQGHIWKLGYENGELKGHLYPEVKQCLEAWKKAGITLGVYSSGSVLAQKLLFGYTEYGDLNPLFTHNFDTKVGHKREESSYKNIVKELNLDAKDVLFLSDIAEELKAAKNSGLQVIQLIRDNQELPTNEFTKVRSFEDIKI